VTIIEDLSAACAGDPYGASVGASGKLPSGKMRGEERPSGNNKRPSGGFAQRPQGAAMPQMTPQSREQRPPSVSVGGAWGATQPSSTHASPLRGGGEPSGASTVAAVAGSNGGGPESGGRHVPRPSCTPNMRGFTRQAVLGSGYNMAVSTQELQDMTFTAMSELAEAEQARDEAYEHRQARMGTRRRSCYSVATAKPSAPPASSAASSAGDPFAYPFAPPPAGGMSAVTPALLIASAVGWRRRSARPADVSAAAAAAELAAVAQGEEAREGVAEAAAERIQRAWARTSMRRREMQAAVCLQCTTRGHVARRNTSKMREALAHHGGLTLGEGDQRASVTHGQI